MRSTSTALSKLLTRCFPSSPVHAPPTIMLHASWMPRRVAMTWSFGKTSCALMTSNRTWLQIQGNPVVRYVCCHAPTQWVTYQLNKIAQFLIPWMVSWGWRAIPWGLLGHVYNQRALHQRRTRGSRTRVSIQTHFGIEIWGVRRQTIDSSTRTLDPGTARWLTRCVRAISWSSQQ